MGAKDTESGPLLSMAPPLSIGAVVLHKGSAGGPNSVKDSQHQGGAAWAFLPT